LRSWAEAVGEDFLKGRSKLTGLVCSLSCESERKGYAGGVPWQSYFGNAAMKAVLIDAVIWGFAPEFIDEIVLQDCEPRISKLRKRKSVKWLSLSAPLARRR
jgi:hypothetical protein